MTIRADYHNHTINSGCAKESAIAKDMVSKLERLGFLSIGFSDHYYPNRGMDLKLKNLRREIGEIDTNIDIFVGVEVDMLSPGILAARKDVLAEYDYVMAASAHYHLNDVMQPLSFEYTAFAQYAYDFMMSSAALDYIDVIVHPFHFGKLKRIHKDFDAIKVMSKFSEQNYARLIDLLKRNDIAIELSRLLMEPEYYESIKPFLLMCKKSGIKFSPGSDAHHIDMVGKIVDIAPLIEKLGINEDDFWSP